MLGPFSQLFHPKIKLIKFSGCSVISFGRNDLKMNKIVKFFNIKKPKFLFTNGPSPLLLLSSDDKASWSTQISWLPQMWRRTQLRHNWQICHLKICHLMSNGVIYTFEFRCPSTRHISSSSTLDHAKIHCVCVWVSKRILI